MQSGNVIAQSEYKTPEEVSEVVHDVIADAFTLDVPVMTRSPADLEQTILETHSSRKQLSGLTWCE
jgi:uncharacterized protein (DUF1697 family)